LLAVGGVSLDALAPSVGLETLAMQFGKTLVGAIIGAALGIGLLIVVYLQFGIDRMWMAIPVAILTGLGVRILAAKGGHPSYLRGAITVVLALGAYFGGLKISQVVVTHRAAAVAKANPPRVSGDEPGGAAVAKEGQPAAAVEPADTPPVVPVHTGVAARHQPIQVSTRDFVMDCLSLAIAALVAYELGRGSAGASKRNMDADLGEPVPSGTHPDA
jgi:hypothetical protein